MRKQALLPTLLGLFLIANAGCDPEQQCNGSYLADLTLDSFESSFDHVENSEEYYSLAHGIVNFVGDLNGCESNAETASSNEFLQKILFSNNASFTNPVIADIAQFTLNALAPGAKGNINDQLAFLQDGYYLIQSIADFTGTVLERNEGNNEDENPLDRSSSSVHQGRVIHVTHASPNPVFDANGNRIFIHRVSTTIRYE